MEELITFRAPYLNIYVKSFLVQTAHYNVFIDSALHSGKAAIEPYLDNGRENVLLLTHGHWDHIGLNKVIKDHGGTIMASEKDLRFLEDFEWHWQYGFGQFERDMTVPPARKMIFWSEIGQSAQVDRFLSEGDVLTFDDTLIEVVALPGHSHGCLGYHIRQADALFTGDAMMERGFFSGCAQYCNFDEYVDSMGKIAALNPKMVYTCHTDPYPDHTAAEAASRSIAFAEQARRTVHAYVEQTKGPLTLGGAAAYLAEATGRGMGGGACVTALNHLYQMRHTDKRIEALVQGYYCNI